MAKDTGASNRTRIVKRFKAPEGLDCREVVMRELTGDDDLVVAVWTDRKLSQNKILATSATGMFSTQTREEVRRSLVAVDGKLVANADDVPYAEMDGFTSATQDWLTACFRSMNRVDAEAAKKSVADAEILTEAEFAKLMSQGA